MSSDTRSNAARILYCSPPGNKQYIYIYIFPVVIDSLENRQGKTKNNKLSSKWKPVLIWPPSSSAAALHCASVCPMMTLGLGTPYSHNQSGSSVCKDQGIYKHMTLLEHMQLGLKSQVAVLEEFVLRKCSHRIVETSRYTNTANPFPFFLHPRNKSIMMPDGTNNLSYARSLRHVSSFSNSPPVPRRHSS